MKCPLKGVTETLTKRKKVYELYGWMPVIKKKNPKNKTKQGIHTNTVEIDSIVSLKSKI